MTLNWDDVVVRSNVKPEFGASHVNCSWRRHACEGHKFYSLENAFSTRNKNSVLRLLQSVGGNYHASNNQARGAYMYASVWYSDSDWAILCNPTTAVLVNRADIESIEIEKQRNDDLVSYIDGLFSSSQLTRELNEEFISSINT
jgi:hypothetical protein